MAPLFDMQSAGIDKNVIDGLSKCDSFIFFSHLNVALRMMWNGVGLGGAFAGSTTPINLFVLFTNTLAQMDDFICVCIVSRGGWGIGSWDWRQRSTLCVL